MISIKGKRETVEVKVKVIKASEEQVIGAREYFASLVEPIAVAAQTRSRILKSMV